MVSMTYLGTGPATWDLSCFPLAESLRSGFDGSVCGGWDEAGLVLGIFNKQNDRNSVSDAAANRRLRSDLTQRVRTCTKVSSLSLSGIPTDPIDQGTLPPPPQQQRPT
ncbi:hypothetical protein VTH06DRAFT_1039 [Thermothelomyces fergusii]